MDRFQGNGPKLGLEGKQGTEPADQYGPTIRRSDQRSDAPKPAGSQEDAAFAALDPLDPLDEEPEDDPEPLEDELPDDDELPDEDEPDEEEDESDDDPDEDSDFPVCTVLFVEVLRESVR